ncbi:L,D-transpeptidase family protein [Polycladidibacter stylochi]|uniref:L,D-transpeptidase family protein n=1 Tax=Polycladidibacter stylochi TaxID=1807766 RepID=UPI000835E1A2|nr:L,D-transpeptidase family protein [Pseudovibrio stylochi]
MSSQIIKGTFYIALTAFALFSNNASAAPDILTHFSSETPLFISKGSLRHYIAKALHGNEHNTAFRDRRDFAAVKLFYENRGYQPIWVKNGKLSKHAASLVEQLAKASEEGLNTDDYPTPNKTLGHNYRINKYSLSIAELRLTQSLLKYAEDAYSGRVNPRSLSKNITLKPAKLDPIDALEQLATSTTPQVKLQAYNPPHKGYQDLKQQLATLRSQKHDTPSVIPGGKLIRPFKKDRRIALLRDRFSLEVAKGEELIYTKDLQERVKEFQSENSLKPDGVIGPRTLLALNAKSGADPIKDVIANMERWRWMPKELGNLHLQVNIPEFTVRLIHNNKSVYQTKVVVGKRKHQTPIFADKMEHIIVNPYWNVPYSIATKEMLPDILEDPSEYLKKGNYEIVAKGKIIKPSRINWEGVSFEKIRIRQRPGRGNALGQIKFMFPNRHNVYMHDTPSKSLFRRSERAFSHGCIRIHRPLAFADALVGFQKNINSKMIRKTLGKKERRFDFAKQIPVYIGYFTAFVDEKGQLQRRPDIYNHNKKLYRFLKL